MPTRVHNGVASVTVTVTVTVTVLHPGCMQADAWATALTVLGLDAGLRRAERQALAALFIVRGARGLEMHATASFLARVQEQA